MRNQHVYEVIIIMMHWKEPENWVTFLKERETLGQQYD